jgi:hypothetical protein
MKAKNRVPEKSEQPKPLLAPLDELRKQRLMPFEENAIALGETRVNTNKESPIDVIDHMLRRAISVCEMVQEMAVGNSPNEIPGESLAGAMGGVIEDVEVAMWIARRMS